MKKGTAFLQRSRRVGELTHSALVSVWLVCLCGWWFRWMPVTMLSALVAFPLALWVVSRLLFPERIFHGALGFAILLVCEGVRDGLAAMFWLMTKAVTVTRAVGAAAYPVVVRTLCSRRAAAPAIAWSLELPRMTEQQRAPRHLLPEVQSIADPCDPCRQNLAARIEKTLRGFGVVCSVDEPQEGPVLSRFRVELARGTRLGVLMQLERELAVALSVPSVRVVAPAPPDSRIAIEVPRERQRIVRLPELLALDGHREDRQNPLRIPVGVDVTGQAVALDLIELVHLLVGGSTGAGKSNLLKAVLCSLLCQATPRDVRLLLIDPKGGLEFRSFFEVPHLLVEPVESAPAAAVILEKLAVEVRRRHELLGRRGFREIDSYNVAVAARAVGDPVEGSSLPHIVVVVDELAALLAEERARIETTLTSLAAMGRTAGVHLVLATQRPSVNVLQGVLKANLPSRLALRVASRSDSLVILDEIGAEKLLGNGDMLLRSAGTTTVRRVQCALVEDGFVDWLAAYWRTAAKTRVVEAMTRRAAS